MHNAAITLFHRDFSPQSAQVRAQIYHKQLPVALESASASQAPDGLGIESLPRLQLSSAVQLTDAWAIMEYLEALYPLPRLLPEEAEGRALLRARAGVANQHLLPLLLPVFLKIKYPQYQGVDVNHTFQRVDAVLQHADVLLSQCEAGRHQLDLADCALAPAMYFVETLPPLHQQTCSLSRFPALQEWWQWVAEQPPITRVLYELQRGFQTYLAS